MKNNPFINLIPLLNNNLNLELGKLPKKYQAILTDYLIPKVDDVPLETLVIDLNAKIAQMLAINRVKVESSLIETGDKSTFPNFYGIIFLPSGEGKDKPIQIINKNLMKNINIDFYERSKYYLENAKKEIEEKAEELYPDSKIKRQEYKAENRPYGLTKEIKTGTAEGLESARKAFQKAGFGGTFFKNGEFADYIIATDKSSIDFLSLINEIYDFGDSDPKIIKSEKDTAPILDVPSNMLVHSSISGLVEGKGRERLLDFLNRGNARRSFLAYPILEQFNVEDFSLIVAKSMERKKS